METQGQSNSVDEQLEQEKLSLRREELALERQRVELDHEIRGRELDLKAQNLSSTSGKGVKVTTAQATILVAIISLASAATGAWISGYFQRELGGIEVAGEQTVEEIRAKAQIDLEQLKFETGLIIKAIEQGSTEQRVKLLRFFANAGLIPRHKESVLSLSDNPKDIPAIGRQAQRCLFVKQKVTFAVDNSIDDATAMHLMGQLTEIYRQWSLASGLSIGPADDAESADILIGYSETADHVIAFSQLPCDGNNARIHLNKQQDWKSTSFKQTSDDNARFLFTVLLHEAGHTIGLSHSESSGSIMSMPPPALSKLTGLDVAAARTLYGTQTSAGTHN